MNSPGFLVLIVVFMIGLFFMTSRSRKKQQAQQDDLQSSLAVGDVVVMTSGISGTIVDLEDERTLDLEIAPDVVTTWLRLAVREKLVATETPETVGDLDADEASEAPVVADAAEVESEPTRAHDTATPGPTGSTATTAGAGATDADTAPGSRDDAVSPSLRKSGS